MVKFAIFSLILLNSLSAFPMELSIENKPLENKENNDNLVAMKAIEFVHDFLGEINDRVSWLDALLLLKHTEKDKFISQAKDYIEIYSGQSNLGEINTHASREALLKNSQDYIHFVGILAETMPMYEYGFYSQKTWAEKYESTLILLSFLGAQRPKKSTTAQANHLSRKQMVSNADGIVLFQRESIVIDLWLDALVNSTIEKIKLLSLEYNNKINNTQNTCTRINKKSKKKKRKPLKNEAPQVKLLVSTSNPESKPDIQGPIIEIKEIQDFENCVEEPAFDFAGLGMAKRKIQKSLKEFENSLSRKLSYEEILELAVKTREEQIQYIANILQRQQKGDEVVKIMIQTKHLEFLTDLFNDKVVKQSDFDLFITSALHGNIQGVGGSKNRITLYQRFRNNILVGFVDVVEYRNSLKNKKNMQNQIADSEEIKKISFSTEVPHSRGNSKSGLEIYPALQKIDKEKLSFFAIVPEIFQGY